MFNYRFCYVCAFFNLKPITDTNAAGDFSANVRCDVNHWRHLYEDVHGQIFEHIRQTHRCTNTDLVVIIVIAESHQTADAEIEGLTG